MKTIERIILKYIIKCSYIISSIMPIRKRIVFASYRMNEIKDNFKFIYDEIIRQNLNYECKFLFKENKSGLLGKIKYLFHMIKATYYMATSEYFLIDDFYFPVYVVNLRKGTEVIQVWHACGAFKKFGYSIIDKNYGADSSYIKYIPIHKNYNHVLVSSKEVIQHYAEAFNMNMNNISPIGIPRTDIFFNKSEQNIAIQKLYTKYPKLKSKKLILYAPTFRGTGQSNAKMDITLDIEKLSKSISKDTLLGIKSHPFVKSKLQLDRFDNIIDLSEYGDINDILLITDILITDYSSIIFEYSLLGRPMIFYAPDRDLYRIERDFYYKYEDIVPGVIVDTTDELIKAINIGDFEKEKVYEFRNKFFDNLDGRSSERFVNNIILKRECE